MDRKQIVAAWHWGSELGWTANGTGHLLGWKSYKIGLLYNFINSLGFKKMYTEVDDLYGICFNFLLLLQQTTKS